MRGIVCAAAVVIGFVGCVAEPALAGAPSGADTCTQSFDGITLADIRAQAQRNGIPELVALNMFATVDKNSDGWICQKKMPSPLTNHYNFVDNQAVGLTQR